MDKIKREFIDIKKITEIYIGDFYTLNISITEDLVGRFAVLTGDYNPLHMDEDFASKTIFRSRVVHGILAGSFVSTLIGMHLPGPGALWVSQQFDFLAPVRLGDFLQLTVIVTQKSDAQGMIVLRVEAKNQLGINVLKGEGKVKIIKEETSMLIKSISDCRVLITGAGRGLGSAIALKFAKEKAHLLLNYNKSKEAVESVAKQAKSLGAQVELVQADISSKEGIKNLLGQIKGVDVVVFNAMGDLKRGLFLEQELSDFERALDFGLRAPVGLLQGVLPFMVDQKFGRIVSILSTATVGAPPLGCSSYVVNKKCLEALTKSIAVEYGKYNICANMVSPSMLRTDMTDTTPERAKQLMEAQTPLKRLASLEEVAANVVFLCSPGAAYINGHNLIVSGGAVIS